MVAASLLTQATLFLALTITISAKPVLERKLPIKLALTKRLGLVNYNVERDLSRVKSLRRIAGNEDDESDSDSDLGSGINTTASDQGVYYTVIVGVGDPPTNYTLQVDTGSSNTWIGANKSYVKTSTSHRTSNNVSVTYGKGDFKGKEFIDQVTIGSDLVITNQSIGVASKSSDFFGVDGILGIGPTDLTLGTLHPHTNTSIPTVTDNLFTSGNISEHLVAISFEPSSNDSSLLLNGELTWGGIDSSKFIGNITYSPISSRYPASTFWGIDANVTYGPNTTLLSTAAGLVDTGTTLLLLASHAFKAYKVATGAVSDHSTGFLAITSAQFGKLQNLSFFVSGVNFTLTPDAQIWPRKFNTDIGGVADKIYLIVSEVPSGHGSPDFIFGMAALQRFYAVFDTANKTVGLAYTSFTNATSNFNGTSLSST